MISGFNEYNKEVNLSDKDFSRIIKKIVKNIIRALTSIPHECICKDP